MAGFEVMGVDFQPQPNYPFEFLQADVMTFLEYLIRRPHALNEFDAISASVPCQFYSTITGRNNQNSHPDLIGPVRELLIRTGKPYVMENVMPAPLRNPVVLCGEMFGLKVIRHRKIETNWGLQKLPHLKHRGRTVGAQRRSRGTKMLLAGDPEAYYFAVYGQSTGPYKGTFEDWQTAMGIDWMTQDELSQAIPPKYTEYVGRQLMHHLGYRPQKKIMVPRSVLTSSFARDLASQLL